MEELIRLPILDKEFIELHDVSQVGTNCYKIDGVCTVRTKSIGKDQKRRFWIGPSTYCVSISEAAEILVYPGMEEEYLVPILNVMNTLQVLNDMGKRINKDILKETSYVQQKKDKLTMWGNYGIASQHLLMTANRFTYHRSYRVAREKNLLIDMRLWYDYIDTGEGKLEIDPTIKASWNTAKLFSDVDEIYSFGDYHTIEDISTVKDVMINNILNWKK